MILHPKARRFIKAKKVPIALLIFSGLVICFADVQASRPAANVAVSVTVKNRCTTDTNVRFQNPRLASAPANTAGEVSVHCSMHTPYTVSLHAGQIDDPSTADSVPYDLYHDPDHAARWGKITGPHELSGVYGAERPPVALYGRPTANPPAQAAPEPDVLTMTVDY